MWEKAVSKGEKKKKKKKKELVDCSVACASQKGTACVDSRKEGTPQQEGVPVHL